MSQTKTIAFLSDARSFGATTSQNVKQMSTHISHIFLVGDRAYKLKRAVTLPYVDYGTAEKRQIDCEREVTFNRLTAPHLYLGVRRITQEADGTLTFDGAGELIDAVVEMRRFAQRDLFDRMAEEGRLPAQLMDALASEIAQFHEQLDPVHQGSGHDNIAGVLEINRAGFATSSVFSPSRIAALDDALQAQLARHKGLLDAREAAGKLRRCHGDLHLRNICMFEGQPLIFDCIEFNEQIATIDTLYDLAFMLMDLWHRDLHGHANRLLNRYLDETGDEDGLPLIAFFMAIRAQVRAHVTATQAEQPNCPKDELIGVAEAYFALAEKLLEASPSHFVALGGFSGSGKSTVAQLLAPLIGAPPGARVIESDRVRKARFGVSAETRLPQSAYDREVTHAVYAALLDRAIALNALGCPVIADAVFSHPGRRADLEAQVEGAGLRLNAFWIEVPADTLRNRVSKREGGPSDATIEVLERQMQKDLGSLSWTRIDGNRGPDDVARDIAQHLDERGK